MAELRTEEEQLEALKKWWQESGKSWVAAILVASAGWYGWTSYQDQQEVVNQQASAVYQEFVQASFADTDETTEAKAFELANKLKSDFADTTYAQYASLFMAKDAIDAKDYATAEKELLAALEKASGELEHIITLRLARVEHALEKNEQALSRLEREDLGAFAAKYYEVKGDILFAMERNAEAREAYEMAVSNQGAQANNESLKMKLDNLASAVKKQAEKTEEAAE